jgi:periplasmic protein CpxP/Spy
MKQSYGAKSSVQALMAAVCLICATGACFGDTPNDGHPGMGPPNGPHEFGAGGGPHPFGPPGPHDMNMLSQEPPPFLGEIKLSDDQGDKVFALLHAAAPKLRDQMKAEHKAREALHELGESASFDDGRARSLSEALATSESQLSLLHVRLDHEIFMVLTPEQRTQIAERRKQDLSHPKGPPAP